MFASLLRLFALRPFLTMGILGVPVLLLIAVGLVTIWLLKFLLFVVLPIVLVVWLVRKLTTPREP
jgi:type IV secretory pathway VirB3-like protein